MQRASTYSVKLIVATALSLTALGIVVRASSAVKEIVFAYAFGVSAETDAFVLAGTFAMFLPTIIGGAIGTALIAALADTQGSFRGSGLVRVTIWIAVIAFACGVSIYLFAPLVMSGLFNLRGSDLQNAISYTRILAPLGVTILLSSAMSALLNSAKQFYLAGIVAVATPLAILAAIILLAERWGLEAAAWGTVVGGVIEVLILANRIVSQRRVFFARGELPAAKTAARFWRSVGVLSFASTVAAVSPMVDQFFLSKLETGSITNFNYASKVNSLLIGVFGTAFSVAIYPYLSDLAAQRDTRGLKRLTWRLAGVVLPITGIATALVYAFSYELVELLFARGKFTDTAVLQVGVIQQIFAFQLPFYIAGLIAMRILNATGASEFILWVACMGMVSNVLFDWLFYESLGAGGIALASVLTSALSLIFTLLFIRPALAGASR